MNTSIDNKLNALSAAARFDVCGSDSSVRKTDLPPGVIYKAALPDGGCSSLFKVLLTNSCINDCAYCVCAASRDIRRTSFKPEELARTFMEFNRRRIAQGLFLSSGVAASPDCAMEGMIKTIEILRKQYRFNGYIHAKMLPGASCDRIEAVCRLSSRVSVNVEAPTAERLHRLSSKKNLLEGIMAPMRQALQFARKNQYALPAGQTTQFVVGAAGENDAEILKTSSGLYQEINLRRIYFSAYRPIGDPRLEGVKAASPWRQHRLYQADWLMRVYGFPHSEVSLALDRYGNLPLKENPKLNIARARPWLFPVDINRASFEELLRVPGIGPLSAKRIEQMRRIHEITSVDQLKKLHVRYREAMPFVWFKGMLEFEKQLCMPEDACIESTPVASGQVPELVSLL
jgi:putative DNA modification/repair radical SAM protein